MAWPPGGQGLRKSPSLSAERPPRGFIWMELPGPPARLAPPFQHWLPGTLQDKDKRGGAAGIRSHCIGDIELALWR